MDKNKIKELLPEMKKLEKMNDCLPGMLAGWLLINQQSGGNSMENLQTLLRLIPEESKFKLFEIVKTDLTSRMETQIISMKEQIERMNI